MPISNHTDLPSSAIHSVIVNTDDNTIGVQYKAGDVPANAAYVYSVENAMTFEADFIAQFDEADFSVGAYINEKVASGVLTTTGDTIDLTPPAVEPPSADPDANYS